MEYMSGRDPTAVGRSLTEFVERKRAGTPSRYFGE